MKTAIIFVITVLCFNSIYTNQIYRRRLLNSRRNLELSSSCMQARRPNKCGTVGKTCGAGQEFLAGLCYKKCETGWKGVACTCFKGGKSKARGCGKPPGCAKGQTKDAGLCVNNCPAGYKIFHCLCVKDCAKPARLCGAQGTGLCIDDTVEKLYYEDCNKWLQLSVEKSFDAISSAISLDFSTAATDIRDFASNLTHGQCRP